jgi:thymidylate kinase
VAVVHETAEPRAGDLAGSRVQEGQTVHRGRDWAPPFIRTLCLALDDAEITWLVLRNHEDLPDRVGHDVDIVVHPDDAPRIDGLIRALVREQGLFLLRVYRGIEHHTFDVAGSDLGGRLLLHVDVQTAARYRGRLLIDAEDLLGHRRRATGGLWTLTSGMEAYALLLHAALHKGALKDKYADRLVALEDAAPGELLRVATERLGPDLGRRLASVRTEPQLLLLRRQLGRAVDRRYPGNRWRRPWFNVRSGTAMTRLRLRPRGLFVVFLGPDGSGKSSTTDLLAEMLGAQSNVLPVHRVYLGSGTPLLPTRKLMRRVHASRRAQNREHVRDVRPRRLRGALHVMADEIVRYWLQVWPRLSPHSIVLADRYAYDVLRINNPTVRRRWFRRLATAIIPSPDIAFFLEGDPAAITARKHELTLAETIRQQEAYRELVGLVPGFRSLDLTIRDEPALRRVALQILDAFAARNGGLPRNGSSSSSGAP